MPCTRRAKTDAREGRRMRLLFVQEAAKGLKQTMAYQLNSGVRHHWVICRELSERC